MKHAFYFLLAGFFIAEANAAAPGCQDAVCASSPVSPFLAAANNPAPSGSEAKQGKITGNIAPREAAPVATPVTAPDGAPAAASNPLRLIFIAGGLAGLYLYLRQDPGRKKRG